MDLNKSQPQQDTKAIKSEILGLFEQPLGVYPNNNSLGGQNNNMGLLFSQPQYPQQPYGQQPFQQYPQQQQQQLQQFPQFQQQQFPQQQTFQQQQYQQQYQQQLYQQQQQQQLYLQQQQQLQQQDAFDLLNKIQSKSAQTQPQITTSTSLF
jgi:hypothetical protein